MGASIYTHDPFLRALPATPGLFVIFICFFEDMVASGMDPAERRMFLKYNKWKLIDEKNEKKETSFLPKISILFGLLVGRFNLATPGLFLFVSSGYGRFR